MRQCPRVSPLTPRICMSRYQHAIESLTNTAKAWPHTPHKYKRPVLSPTDPYAEFSYKPLRCFSSRGSLSRKIEIEEQQRITNLGSMTNHLKALVPKILQKSLPKDLLSPNVLLRICPSHFEQINSYLPTIKGHVSYFATCKAAQLFLTSFVLNPQAHLHIESIRTSNFPDSSCLYNRSSKIFIRWSTCPEGCSHLSSNNIAFDASSVVHNFSERNRFLTANAKLGSHRWSKIDARRVLDYSKRNRSISGSISDLGMGIIGLKKDDSKLERIISGLFIFELNERNDQIVVHTIDDLNIIEKRTEETVQNKLRIC